ncbi:hypothetical protein FRC05_006519 [Tulasnella sp. 425]|nr:hypothetical protein FRC05_006519 [Tulasnella sp. 425]
MTQIHAPGLIASHIIASLGPQVLIARISQAKIQGARAPADSAERTKTSASTTIISLKTATSLVTLDDPDTVGRCNSLFGDLHSLLEGFGEPRVAPCSGPVYNASSGFPADWYHT